ncbi:pseudouridine synthase [Lysobacter arenosi]|uniref:Pseudouridine synthase n=1 Tax=Lysobacter arenosi TaxID=2795387 RepID=A0ABX7REV4_9GAMM|nr:pseudouridine synthase [Lysobacter arenosi]
MLEGLCARFPSVGRARWLDRIERGLVRDADGRAVAAEDAYRVGAELTYYREVEGETEIPFDEVVLHADEHLVVVDKPHFLPVTPAGKHVEQTLLARLVRRLGNADLVPLHRIDRGTAGLVLFSARADTRALYQALFPQRSISKRYEALAPALPEAEFPLVRRSHLERGEPFFRMREGEGAANSETRIEVLDRSDGIWRYALEPVTGRKHQLRVHMAAIGVPILNDPLYPDCGDQVDDYARPLKLLARSLQFVDPLSGQERRFESQRDL